MISIIRIQEPLSTFLRSNIFQVCIYKRIYEWAVMFNKEQVSPRSSGVNQDNPRA